MTSLILMSFKKFWNFFLFVDWNSIQTRLIPNFLECQDYLDPTKESVWRISEVVKLECIYCETCSSNQGSIENIDNSYTNGEDKICDVYFWNMKNILASSGDMRLFFSVNLKL